jgi:leader peptidase (prepilin peptidase)/N-methyltransferase
MGLGLGDVKLAAAAAAWFSLWMLPLFLFVASFSALVFLLASSAGGAKSYTRKIPFGPFLAGALIVTWNTERIYGTSFGALS